jgi:hypothetical protein
MNAVVLSSSSANSWSASKIILNILQKIMIRYHVHRNTNPKPDGSSPQHSKPISIRLILIIIIKCDS